jgi:ACS family glucarate transporter-like MFS transporter
MSLVLWSVFTMLQGTVGWIGMTGSLAAMTLFLMRFMLGLVESPHSRQTPVSSPVGSRRVSVAWPRRCLTPGNTWR